jgi:hypothetical protein
MAVRLIDQHYPAISPRPKKPDEDDCWPTSILFFPLYHPDSMPSLDLTTNVAVSENSQDAAKPS